MTTKNLISYVFFDISFYMTILLCSIVASLIWMLYLNKTFLFIKFGSKYSFFSNLNLFPNLITFLRFVRSICGFEIKFKPRKYGNGIWSYAEKGKLSKKYPTFVFLHGIGCSKDHWLTIVQNIPKKYHCIAVDLPGHG